MRKIFTICILLLLVSCFNTGTQKTELLNQRITRLEQRIDSLINGGNINLIGSDNNSSNNSVSTGTVRQTNRCQAITKKGTQCKRAAEDNGYCWQHGR
ncbi:MAG TPA: DUF5763 domain-containing protein [Chitinophagaceae bacterium]